MIRTHGSRPAGWLSVDLSGPILPNEFKSGGRIKIGRNVYGIRSVEREQRGIIPGRMSTRVHLSCPLVFDVPHGTVVAES